METPISLIQATFPIFFADGARASAALAAWDALGFPRFRRWMSGQSLTRKLSFSVWQTGRHGGYICGYWDSLHVLILLPMLATCLHPFHPFHPICPLQKEMEKRLSVCSSQKEMLQLSSIWVLGLPIHSLIAHNFPPLAMEISSQSQPCFDGTRGYFLQIWWFPWGYPFIAGWLLWMGKSHRSKWMIVWGTPIYHFYDLWNPPYQMENGIPHTINLSNGTPHGYFPHSQHCPQT